MSIPGPWSDRPATPGAPRRIPPADSASSGGLEFEIKLGVPPARIAALRRHSALRGQGKPPRWQTRHLVSTYYDTPELALHTAGMTLRVRRDGEHFRQTVKSEDPTLGAVFARNEWEVAIPAAAPDPAAIADAALRARLAELVGEAGLIPVFETRIERSRRRIRWGNSVAELALDHGTIRAGATVAEVAELELELLAGDPSDLVALATVLAETVPVRLETTAKSSRGYALYSGTTARPAPAPTLAIPPDTPASEAFRLVLRHCLGHALANEPALRESADPEAVHQMRVALRRLRSAIGVFGPTLDASVWTPLRREIGWVASALGPARDWDVFVTETAPPAYRAFAGVAGMTGLAEAASAMQARARATARQALATPRYATLMLALSRRCLPGQIAAGEGLPQTAGDLASARLERRHRSVVKGVSTLRHRPVPELHELRIRVKKLRYAAGFFVSLFPGKAGRRYLAAAAALQEVLGHLNDAGTVHALLDRMLVEHPLTDPRCAGMVEGWVAARAVAQQAKLERAWDRFRNCRRFWPRPDTGG